MPGSSRPIRFGRRRQLSWGVFALIAIAVGLRLWRQIEQPAPSPEVLVGEEYQLERAVDGDTLLLKNRARVRLLGVDTPEVFDPSGSGKRLDEAEPWGKEASDFTKKFVAGGTVRLEFDKERKDKFGRFLAYVWVDDKMLNEELIRAGLAKHTPWHPYSDAKKRLFAKAQEEAKANRRGIWSGM
ncbi:MAG: thermonuclease family protein [Pirellulales bacterium]|nr:thermonuclease family protein [Pirellulales bacterium]